MARFHYTTKLGNLINLVRVVPGFQNCADLHISIKSQLIRWPFVHRSTTIPDRRFTGLWTSGPLQKRFSILAHSDFVELAIRLLFHPFDWDVLPQAHQDKPSAILLFWW
jgi:hypothetical protein